MASPVQKPAQEEESLRIAFVAGTLLAALDLSDTMLFPFLAEFLMAHGIAQSRIALIFALLSLGIFLTAPFMGYVFAKVGGPSRALVIGALTFGGVRVLTAFLPLISNGTPMLVCSSILFFVTGCVYAFSEVGALAWVLLAAPSGHKVEAMGVLVSSRALGAMLGTPVGGLLFDFVGWSPTNAIGALILFAPLAVYRNDFFNAPESKQDGDRDGTRMQQNALRDPRYVLANVFNLIAQSGLYMIVPYLQPYFAQQYGTPKWAYGLIAMLCLLVGYMGGSTLAVQLNAVHGYQTAVAVGLALFLLGGLLLGPSPLLGSGMSDTGVWEAVLGWAIMLSGSSILVVLSPTIALQFAQDHGLSEEEATIQTSSLSVSIMGLGLFFGPVSGSILAEAFGVPWTNTILGGVCAAVGALSLLAIWLVDKCKAGPEAGTRVGLV